MAPPGTRPTDKYESRKYDDFVDDGTLDKDATGGWIALLQHYFFAAWIPGEQDKSTFTLTTHAGRRRHALCRACVGPRVDVAPGATAETECAPVGRPEAGRARSKRRTCRA